MATITRNTRKQAAPKTVRSVHQILVDSLTKAHKEGVQLIRIQSVHFALSATLPGVVYMVADDGCTCPGHLRHGYCKHWAAYLSGTGQLGAVTTLASTFEDPDHMASTLAELIHAEWGEHLKIALNTKGLPYLPVRPF